MDAQFLPKGSKSFAAFRFSASKKNAWLSFTTPQLRHFEVQHAAGAGARTAAAVHSWAWTSEQDMTGDQVEDELKMVQDLTKSTELCRMQRSCVPQEKCTSSNHLFIFVPVSYLFVPIPPCLRSQALYRKNLCAKYWHVSEILPWAWHIAHGGWHLVRQHMWVAKSPRHTKVHLLLWFCCVFGGSNTRYI